MELSNQFQEFLQLGVVGIALSFLVQYIKDTWGTESNTTRALTILLSVVLGAGYFFLEGTAIWLAMVSILGSATTFYALFIRK